MKLPLILALAALICSCSKTHLLPNPKKGGDVVSWRFVVYDSNNRVVDSTAEVVLTDTVLHPPMLGPNVFSFAPIPGNDTIYWPQVAYFTIALGPYTYPPQDGSLEVEIGGCAITVQYDDPTLDRSGWNLQRKEKGVTVDMFSPKAWGWYDGKYNDFPFDNSYNGISFPWAAEDNLIPMSYICGSTPGSCQMSIEF